MIFGILGKFRIEIGDPNFFCRKIFRRKKFQKSCVENFLGPKNFVFLSNFFSMKKLMKIQNFEISKIFRKKIEISKFWIFINFFIEKFFDQKSKIFGPKNFPTKSFRIFFRRKNYRPKKFRAPISMPNDPKIPKIILRTAYDHYKITNSVHEKKTPFFLLYLTSDPVLGGWGSWTFCLVCSKIYDAPPDTEISDFRFMALGYQRQHGSVMVSELRIIFSAP